MVAGSTIVQVIGAVLTAAGLVGSGGLRVAGHPADRYEDKVKQLQEHHWGEICAVLGEVVNDVRDANVLENNDHPEEVPDEGKYGLYIQREYSRGDLDELEAELSELDDAKQAYQDLRGHWDSANKRFLSGTGISLVSILTLVASNHSLVVLISAIIIGFGGGAISIGILYLYRWHNTRAELDDMWEDYHFM